MDSVSVAFGGIKALNKVSLALNKAGVFGLIGPNGAGKSTCINVLTGFQKVSEGSFHLSGAALNKKSPDEVRRLGVSRTFQAGRLFSRLTTKENVAAAAIGLGRSRKAAYAEADDVLAWLGLHAISHVIAGALPYTDQRRVSIARAIVGGPSVLMLDEPAAGMSTAETKSLEALLRKISEERQIAILLVEHNIAFVMAICGEITVLDGGSVIAHGTPQNIRKDERVREAYFGAALDAAGIGNHG